jgi:hypothetical protein
MTAANFYRSRAAVFLLELQLSCNDDDIYPTRRNGSKSCNTDFESTRSAGPAVLMRIDAAQLAPAIIVIGGFCLLEQNFLVRAGGRYFSGDRIAANVTRCKCSSLQVVGRRPVTDVSGKSGLRGEGIRTPSLGAFDRKEKQRCKKPVSYHLLSHGSAGIG